MKHSLSINKKLLYEHIAKESTLTNNMDLIKEIKVENTRLNQTLNKNVEAKIVLEQNVCITFIQNTLIGSFLNNLMISCIKFNKN